MRRLFSKRTNEKVDAVIDPYTFDEDNSRNDHTQEILMGHTNGSAYQDISIGASRRRPVLRRMMSLESDFRISRVDLSPLTQDDAKVPAQSEITNVPHEITNDLQKPHEPIRRQNSTISFAHPYAAESENFRDISSAARAYLPNSTSFLTTTTSDARLYNGQMSSKPSSFQLSSKPSGEMNSWPSSILMHPLNTISQKANASSPIRRKVPPSDQISWRESLEQQLGLESEIDKQDSFYNLDHFSDHDIVSKDAVRSSTLAMHRKRSVPVLRGVSHANRQRQSMLVSLAQNEPEVDEFGQLITPPASRLKPYSTKVVAKAGVSTQNDPEPGLFSSQRSAKTTRASNNRDTFGILIGGRKETSPDLPCSLPQTPPRIGAMACPPTLGLDTPALIGTQSTFGETPQREIRRDFLHTSISSSRSTRSRLRMNDAKEIVLQPSPHSSTFRFPALCIAAMDRAEAMAEALASPHYTDRAQLGNHSPSISLASARFERPSTAASQVSEEQDHAMQVLLGSPIKLTSEEPGGAQSNLKSRFSSSSDSSFVHCESSDEESKIEAPERTLMKEAKSDTHIIMMDRSRKPRSLFESESMPTVKLEAIDQLPVTPPKRAVEIVKADKEEAQRPDVERASLAVTKPVPKSSLVVSSIIEQQEEVMQRLRRSSKWSPANIKGLSPTLEARSRSSWTWAASTDVELDLPSDQEVQDPSSMDKCVDWDCNAVSYDANAALNPIVDVNRKPSSLTCSESQTKASSDGSHDAKTQKKSYMVDKAVQTDACPPPRPVRNEARRVDSKKTQKAVTPIKPPDICILLASPRRGDDQNPLDGLSLNVGLGIVSNEEDPNEGTMDESLLTPRAIEDPIPIHEGSNTTLEIFDQEMDALIQTLSSTFTPIAKKYNGIPLTSVSEEGSTEVLDSPPLSSSTTVTILQAPRESTTTATIEAMIEQLRVAQRTPERLVLNKGGRRHENRAQQD
ncbi:uncharacterized protein FA14DRAFT_157921 [Meira miltonrushii]|uniref:Uncharacterized protein n=1 Tax=Meira miltonrushii TaxID=1280837 RepID=A0A316V3F3_9BASI|nr:uncharacterized protein FA14DRAFT_157921 [Meira miltonrushii]PWN31982.1 hypothetical protein FA14DRAFT_157921 [Meira miltonrushii]